MSPADKSGLELRMTFALKTEEEARSFVIASADLAAVPGTKGIRIIDWADVVDALPPPKWRDGHPAEDSPWVLVGVIIGPDADSIPDGHLPAMETAWSLAVLDILEAYGLPKPGTYDEGVVH